MFGWGHHNRTAWRGAFLTLAFLALAIKVAVPSGFMIAAPAPGQGLGAAFNLVICTGHGPMTVGQPDHKGGENKSRSDAPCAFAGHAAPPVPSLGATLIGSAYVQTAEIALPRADLTPGRGLAAPPPPSRGPPTYL